MDQGLFLKLSYSIDPSAIVSHSSTDWVQVATLCVAVPLLVGIASYSSARGIKAVRMERANRTWSKTYQTWRCRWGCRPDLNN